MLLKNKNILVVGLGKSGIGTVNTLLKLKANISVYDKNTSEKLKDMLCLFDVDKVDLILGKYPENIEVYDLIVLSPGVPTDLDFIIEAKNKNKLVIGELELAYKLCKAKFIAITGTNGKTTTTTLIGEIFKNAKIKSEIVGNIGIAAISKSLEVDEETTMITEVSSFQLESIKDFKPYISAILNITPDHLNRHKTMANYIDIKTKIFKNQSKDDILILNADDKNTYDLKDISDSKVIFFSKEKKLDEGVFISKNNIVIKKEKNYDVICNIDELLIPGKHNIENALASVAIAYYAGIDKDIISYTLKNFKGVEHRIESVSIIDDVEFINDSKGTNPDASIKAIEAMKKPIILIAGGLDKGSDFTKLIHSFKNKVIYCILIGETAEKIKKTANNHNFYNITIVKTMDEAVTKSYEISNIGDVVLLSPACASWDMYPSFEVRGNDFKKCVNKLRR